MLCDMCKKREAVYHTKVIHNGVVRERHLCNECRMRSGEEEKNVGLDMVGDIMSALSGFMPGVREHAVCKVCGMSGDEFLETGYLGCPNCYKTFSGLIMPELRRGQHDTRHVGKCPGGDGKAAIRAKIEQLNRKKQIAIENNDFNEAQRLYDTITELEKSINGGGEGNE